MITYKELCNTIEKLTPADAFIVLALFEGLKVKEIAALTKEDILNDSLRLTSGRKLSFSPKLIDLANISVNTYHTHKSNDISYHPDDNHIVKALLASQIDVNQHNEFRITNHLKEIKRQYHFINSSEIRYSGMIHCINEMTNKEFSAIDVLNSPKRKLIEYRYGTISSIKKFIEKYKDYLH